MKNIRHYMKHPPRLPLTWFGYLLCGLMGAGLYQILEPQSWAGYAVMVVCVGAMVVIPLRVYLHFRREWQAARITFWETHLPTDAWELRRYAHSAKCDKETAQLIAVLLSHRGESLE